MRENLTLAVEVGNSRIKAATFDSTSSDRLPECRCATAIPARTPTAAAEISKWLALQNVHPDRCVIGSVNPIPFQQFCDDWNAEWGPLIPVERPPANVLTNRTETPDQVGSDRLFDAVAANRLRRPGQPAIVVDSGTATTVNMIDATGAFVGGAILPGFELMATALHERTAKLPRIEVEEFAQPPDPLGRNTIDAIRSGLFWGLAGGVKELVDRFTDLSIADSRESPLLLLTGGASLLLASCLPGSHREPHLTLQGLILSAIPD